MALAFGLLTVVVFYGSLFAIRGGPQSIPAEEWPFLLFQVLLVSAPFGLLSLAGIRAKLPWLVAALLTVCFWGAYFASGLIAARERTGANIGMGLLMLLSPAVIAGGAWAAVKVPYRRR